MPHIDSLSRSPVENPETDYDCMEHLGKIFTVIDDSNELVMYQYSDELLKCKKEILNKPQNQRTKYEISEINK